MIKVVISDAVSQAGVDLLRNQDDFHLVHRAGMTREELFSEMADAEALIVRSKTKVTAELFEAAPKLRVVGRAGAGVDNIDLETATKRGVVVMNTPGGNSVSAAEHALALLLTLARKVPFAHQSVRAGEWKKSQFVGRELRGKTLGVVGLGKIGSVLAQRAQAFQMQIVGYDPFITESYAADLGVELLSLDSVFERSDFLSLHLPLNEKTRHLINAKTIAGMKDGAIIINAARGGLICEDDLVDALARGKLGGAALDVFESEPEISPRLREADNVILTPHIAGSTVEAQARVGYDIALQVRNYLCDDVISNAVNFPSLAATELAVLLPYIRLGERLGSLAGQICGLRVAEIGLRYYGVLTEMNYKALGNYILKAILRPTLSEEVNEVNARAWAKDRGISVVETVSSRQRSYSNLVSVQLRSKDALEWVEGAILHKGELRLISIDGIPVETELGENILFIRNDDRPGVIGRVGTLLGEAGINIASFVLGRSRDHEHAVGVVNTDSDIPEEVLHRIQNISEVQSVHLLHFGSDSNH